MNDSKMYSGSIDVTEFLNMLNKRHSSFSKSAKNNKVYANIVIWQNPTADEYGNNISIQLSSVKEKRETEKVQFGKGYIGNAKLYESQNKPVSDRDLPRGNWDANIEVRPTDNVHSEADSELPF